MNPKRIDLTDKAFFRDNNHFWGQGGAIDNPSLAFHPNQIDLSFGSKLAETKTKILSRNKLVVYINKLKRSVSVPGKAHVGMLWRPS